MFHRNISLRNWSWPRPASIGLVVLGFLVMGQACSISFGNAQPKDGGVFRSDDNGKSWQQKVFVSQEQKKVVQINDVSVLGFAFDPEDSQRIFLGTREHGVWRTENSGERWQSTSLRAGGYQCLAFDPTNSQILYTASGTTVLKSQDGGKEWQAIYNESQPNHVVTCVVTDPVDSREVWATTSGGKVLLSQDFGQTWTLMQTLKEFIPRRLYLPPDGSGNLYIFSEGSGIFFISGHGTIQTDLSEALGKFAGGMDINSVTIVTENSDRWYLGTNYGLLVSTDRGVSWQSIPTLVNPGSIPITTVAARPNDPGELYITVGQKLHHTTDGGQTWEVTNLPTTRIPTWLVIDPSTPDRLYFSTLKPLE